jgi:hypothetical protein
MRQVYSIVKASEGGISQAEAKAEAKHAGLTKIVTFGSIYIGQFCLAAEGTKAQHRKFERAIWGS